jgi:hypothetical protein
LNIDGDYRATRSGRRYGALVTTKFVHAFTDDVAEALLAPELREQLAAAGVRRLQVNVDDAPVADALRLQTGATAYRAVVMTWTDGDAELDAVNAVLAAVAPVTGWRVDERVPTEPPAAEDGVRADTLANIAFIRRPAETSYDDWIAHWHGPHTIVAVETQATFGYIQNVVVAKATPEAADVDGIVEELFPMAGITDMHAFYGSDGDDAELGRRLTRLMESVAILGADHDIDLVPTGRYVFDLRA